MKTTNSTQRPKGAEFQGVSKDYREWIEIGDVRVARLEGGVMWMSHRRGEGAEVDQKKLAQLLEEFFWREF
jgi:hypothetical protein